MSAKLIAEVNFIRKNKIISVLALALIVFIYSKQPSHIIISDGAPLDYSDSIIQINELYTFYFANNFKESAVFSISVNKILFDRMNFGIFQEEIKNKSLLSTVPVNSYSSSGILLSLICILRI